MAARRAVGRVVADRSRATSDSSCASTYTNRPAGIARRGERGPTHSDRPDDEKGFSSGSKRKALTVGGSRCREVRWGGAGRWGNTFRELGGELVDERLDLLAGRAELAPCSATTQPMRRLFYMFCGASAPKSQRAEGHRREMTLIQERRIANGHAGTRAGWGVGWRGRGGPKSAIKGMPISLVSASSSSHLSRKPQ